MLILLLDTSVNISMPVIDETFSAILHIFISPAPMILFFNFFIYLIKHLCLMQMWDAPLLYHIKTSNVKKYIFDISRKLLEAKIFGGDSVVVMAA